MAPGGRLLAAKDVTHRPQSWFQLHRGYRQELRLRTNTTDADGIQGEALTPFGWITHIHKAKSGYLERTALFRQLVWTYLFKNYSVGDLAEFLEIYGIPVRLGTRPTPASARRPRCCVPWWALATTRPASSPRAC
jgi:phage gp29-like protein